MVPAKSVVEVQPLMVSHVCFGASFRARIRPASLNQEKRYFNMTYQQIKDWMENYELWD